VEAEVSAPDAREKIVLPCRPEVLTPEALTVIYVFTALFAAWKIASGLCLTFKKSLHFVSSLKHYGAGCLHPDNREVRVNRTLCPQL
jgi:hypothetical protein